MSSFFISSFSFLITLFVVLRIVRLSSLVCWSSGRKKKGLWPVPLLALLSWNSRPYQIGLSAPRAKRALKGIQPFTGVAAPNTNTNTTFSAESRKPKSNSTSKGTMNKSTSVRWFYIDARDLGSILWLRF